ncbi:MoxR-like ATPase [Desulfofundulus luciae]|uniref:MoxR-like ATPase n=1 Tax=Desulfofundulus luciae TaxID=74702 RepID=A0ABU0B4C4_9FIRM|nr:MoxR family ATPase [Desulfofundulus luciae]MDQ0287564.1 MoxR-like ATPase [Desulfofundulus luciae]
MTVTGKDSDYGPAGTGGAGLPAPEGAEITRRLHEVTRRLGEMQEAIGRVIVGQQEVVHQVLIALLAGGHVLLEGIPGLGKTVLVRTIGQVTGLTFRRIQFTPDLMPADVTGTMVFEERGSGGPFRFVPGPIFANIVLADEINRATPKTQSALLEAMQERTVTVGGTSYPLPNPFFVLATQNPLEMEGTYPLPEAQLDRFLFKVNVPYPTAEELAVIAARTTGAVEPPVPALLEPHELLEWLGLVRQVVVVEDIMNYAVRLVLATQPENPHAPERVRRFVRYGSSPRGLQALILGARAEALREGRPQVVYRDVQRVTPAALRHRLILGFEAAAEGVTADDLVAEILATVPAIS